MRILVAEDHAPLARSIANGLREEGFAVDLTGDGEEALQLARHNPYDCVVLDVMLPGRDGWSVLQHLRRAGIKSPVLMLTARDAVEDRVKGLNLGADDYLVKPFAWEELVARVRALVRRGHDQKSPLLRVADLEIDTAGKQVHRAGKLIPLSAKEYALLEYLAHREGQVVSRAEIWDHLYDQADEASSNVVDVYIGYLRNKVDREFEVKLIHTRRGLGYVLSAEP
ncbi:MAG TPA: response regulator transcription factor [Castellaniella sp.]|nr:response regulator transcription factor [Castellaniella sp.]